MRAGAVVLAAGKGTRMRSEVPKVLHRLAGRPLISWVLAAVAEGGVEDVVVVLGYGADDVRSLLPPSVRVAVQEEQLGTGHAALVGLAELDPACEACVVICGDTPLVEGSLVRRLVDEHVADGRAATIVTAVLDDPEGYGRVVRDGDGAVRRVVEARDATPSELEIAEINTGLFCFDRAGLERALARVSADNAQGEIYLPDTLTTTDGAVAALVADDPDVVQGVNSRIDLAACEAVLQRRLREDLMIGGVTMPDPGAVYLDADVRVGPDTVLWPGVHLRGTTTVGSGCEIGPDVVMSDSRVDDGATVVSAHVLSSEIGPGAQVGPFAYLRPGVRLEAGAKAGTFVEMKNSTIGPGSKVPHLSYIGDADIGAGSNIGAGNITANYDGFRKHRTTIGERVKTGSDCVFVAPVEIGDDTMTGAGSIITDDIPDGALGIARARQSNIEGFTAKAADRARRAAEEAERNGGG
jgi:bifunctional UDP-N-acetylglucosamine pyrophosphorylase/glucosamine-1-phosphate N-acetyltransferase